MNPLLGVSVSAVAVRAVLVQRGAIVWAGQADYHGAADLAEVLARLASEPAVPVRRARLVFERDVVQLRTVTPAPPLKAEALRRYVALEATRLFRKNGAPLITDGLVVAPGPGARALWAGAVAEPLAEAAAAGCTQAGVRLEAVGAAAEVLPWALATRPTAGDIAVPNGTTTEVLAWGPRGVWRSRRVPGVRPGSAPWHAALAAMGTEAAHFAPAYAATRSRPRLDLSPPSRGAARRGRIRQRRRVVAASAAALWLLALASYAGRLAVTAQATRSALAATAPAVDTALALRRNLDAATATLATIAAAERSRSRELPLLAALTGALGDSTYLVAFRAEQDGTLRLVGYAPAATRVLAELESVPMLTGAKLEGPVTREAAPSGQALDRFAIVARRRRPGRSL